MNNWAHIENIATLVAIAFLCWCFGNYWGLVLVLNLNHPRTTQSNRRTTTDKE